jgi:hypothetical protein
MATTQALTTDPSTTDRRIEVYETAATAPADSVAVEAGYGSCSWYRVAVSLIWRSGDGRRVHVRFADGHGGRYHVSRVRFA